LSHKPIPKDSESSKFTHISFIPNEIVNSKGNMQRLWKTLHSALGETSGGETGDHTADEFATFFTDKVALVRASTATTPLYDAPLQATPQLTEWTALTVEEVEKLIDSAPIRTCQLDPVPTWLVKDMRSLLSPFVALLFNASLVSGCFPSEFKQAVIRPLLKTRKLCYRKDDRAMRLIYGCRENLRDSLTTVSECRLSPQT